MSRTSGETRRQTGEKRRGRGALTTMALPFLGPLLGALLAPFVAPGVARADVRDGVSAWSRGDYAEAVRQWQGPAAKGDADAEFNMGQAAKLGRGMPRDMARAEDWFHKAARQGHARAADNYGILLFQTGRQTAAMPWLSASADRGEPRAMYLLGVAAFNGDYQPKDWVRAYALMTRAASAGLPQAMDSLKTMNATIPLQQRQMGASLASDLEKRTSDTRSRELAAAELGVTGPSPVPGSATSVVRAPASASTGALASAALPPSQSAPRPVQPDGPVLAGASFAHPVEVPRAHAVAKPEARVEPKAKAEPKPKAEPKVRAEPKPEPKPERKPEPRPRPGGTWRIQLGAFSQKSNADAIWARARGRAELAGHPRIDSVQGSVTRVLAGGFAGQAEASHACAALKGAGIDCIIVRP